MLCSRSVLYQYKNIYQNSHSLHWNTGILAKALVLTKHRLCTKCLLLSSMLFFHVFVFFSALSLSHPIASHLYLVTCWSCNMMGRRCWDSEEVKERNSKRRGGKVSLSLRKVVTWNLFLEPLCLPTKRFATQESIVSKWLDVMACAGF